MKVLIIDNDQSMLDIAAARLRDDDVEVLCATGGQAGLDMAAAHRPDVILLDVDMPGMSGFDVCRILKADDELHMIPIIFLTAMEDTAEKVKGLDLGATDYITKPFDAFELRARVQAALRTKLLEDMLIECALIDPLTALPNRRAFMQRAQAEWARSQRKQSVFSIIMADVDRFKDVNDRHGHAMGDRLLREIARAITSQCRQTDTPSRHGGEEFAILVPAETAPAAASLAERCRHSIEQIRLHLEGCDLHATASFGVADSVSAGSLDEVIERADQAMYQAKNAGRNTVRCAAGADVGTITR